MVLGIWLRLWRLGGQELWLDEAATWTIALQPLHGIVTDVFRTETNPPLFNILTHAAVAVFGDSEAALRLVSVVASSLTIATVFAAASIAVNRRAGMFAAAFLAVSSGALNYAQEARAYALAALLEALVLLGLMLALRSQGRRAQAGWLLVSLAGTACIYTHYTTVFFLACAFSGAALYLLAVRDGRGIRRLAISAAGIAVLAAPALLQMAQLRSSALISWIPRVDAPAAFRLAVTTFGYPHVYAGQPWLNLLVALVWLGGVVWLARAQQIVPLLGGVLLASPLLLFAVSQLATPIFIARTLFPLTSLLAILVGIAIAAPRQVSVQLGLAALLLAPGLLGCINYYQISRSADRYREVARFLGEAMRPGDLAIGTPGIAYYRTRLGLDFPLALIFDGIPRVVVPGLAAYPDAPIDPAAHAGGTLYVVTLRADADRLFAPGAPARATAVQTFGRDVVYAFRAPSAARVSPPPALGRPMANSAATPPGTP
jgi:mannosyltransferase